MSLRLILVRHAKSSWGDPTLPDHARPLNKRGRGAAPAMAKWLAAAGHIPAQVLASSAQRTVETWQYMAPQFPSPPQAERVGALYHAAPETMLDVLRGAHATPVMMIGHNPGIAAFASRLLANPARHPRFHDYPTCATLVAAFDADDWRSVGFAQGRLLDFKIPADLLPK